MLETRLANIDRRLRDLQAELMPERDPRPVQPPSRPPRQARRPEPRPQQRATDVPRREPTAQPRQEREAPPPGSEHAGGRSGPLAALLQRQPPSAHHEAGAQHHEGPPGDEVPAPRDEAPAAPHAELVAMLCRRLLSSTRELLDGYEALLESNTATSARRPKPPPEPLSVSVSAGPFRSTEQLREFERGLAAIPGVTHVTLRGFEGSDRAIVDVHLQDRTS